MEVTEIEKMSDIEDNHWWFCGKRDLVKKHIGNKSGLLLDIGCGTGANLKAFSQSANSVGVEFSKDALKLCRNRVDNHLVRCSAEKLPFKNSIFNSITILDVLEHLDKDVDSMKEIRRVLKISGKAIISVPAHMFLWDEHDVLLHHKRRYSMKELECKLKKTGFYIKKISYWNFLLFPLVAVYKFLNNGTDTKKTNMYLNALLYSVLSIDNFLIKRMYLPIGVSIFCVAEKQ